MTAVVIGIIFVVLGGYGLLFWFKDFVTVLRGFLPVSILVGGIVALISGIGSLRPKRSDEKAK